MPDQEEQVLDSPTLTEEEKKGTDEPNKGEPKPEEILKDKRVQAEIDRRVTQALKKASEDAKKQQEEAIREAERRAEEKKLLEDGKTKELYEAEKTRREELEERIRQQERTENLNKLLDKKQVLNPKMRQVFHAVSGDLTTVDSLIDDANSVIEEIIEQRVNERLKSDPPPQSDERDSTPKDKDKPRPIKKRSDFRSDAEKATWIRANGLDAFKKLPE